MRSTGFRPASTDNAPGRRPESRTETAITDEECPARGTGRALARTPDPGARTGAPGPWRESPTVITKGPELSTSLSFPVFTDASVELVVDPQAHAAASVPASGESDPSRTVRVPPPGPDTGFATMAGVIALTDAALPVLGSGAMGARDELTAQLCGFRNAIDRAEPDGLLPLTRSAVLGVTRRLHRESHDSAVIIDRLARTLAASLTPPTPATGAGRGRITVLVERLDLWDRPSLRVLYRLCLLSGNSGPLVVASAHEWHGMDVTGLTPLCRLAADARIDWLNRLRDLPHVVWRIPADEPVVDPAEPASVARHAGGRWLELRERSFETALLELENALAFQNFEHFFFVAAAALEAARDPEEISGIHRLTAIAEVQSGHYDAAMEWLRQARSATAVATTAAHISGLMGLLRTERTLSPAEGARHHDEGLALLEAAEVTPRAAVEHGWLLNGKALSLAMSARRAATQQERTETFDRAFRLCSDALARISGLSGGHAEHLRHNLVSDITFLLEITGRHREGARFWERAFGGLAATGASGCLVPYHARLGRLLGHERDDGAQEHFAQATTHARRLGDRFHEERIRYARGYACFRADRFDAAVQHFRTGAHLAAGLCDRTGYFQQLSGALVALVEAGDAETAAALAERSPLLPDGLAGGLRAAGTVQAQRQVLTLNSVRLEKPLPELPAYIAHVDLEGTEEESLSRIPVTPAGTGDRGAGRGE